MKSFIRPYGLVALLCTLILVALPVVAQPFEASRLNDGLPIVTSSLFSASGATDREGANINGPSVIRIPEWIPQDRRASPNARYYLYFAHHKGRYIRMAWASDVEGPWHLHRTGKSVPEGERGVLDMGDDAILDISDSLSIRKHIASPDVHIDAANRRIIMYFHGPVFYRGERLSWQKSFVATSPWGLDFSQDIKPVILGGAYFRVFSHDNTLYALAAHWIFTAPDYAAPWSSPPGTLPSDDLWHMQEAAILPRRQEGTNPEERKRYRHTGVRHSAIYKSGSLLHIFFTVKGDSPERIYQTSADLDGKDWMLTPPAGKPVEVLRAEQPWEGSEVPPSESRNGQAKRLENQLRDPFIFEEDGKLYLFYTGGGEQAIGLALLRPGSN